MTESGPDPTGGATPDGGTDHAGSRISGRFELGELIGSGGSASVFAATDASGTGISVALKMLHPHLSGSQASRTAFFAEARAAERVKHPNVVRVLATGVHEGAGEKRAWIAFERAPGVTLDEFVAANGPLEPAAALAVTDGILRALEAIHAAGIVHRDLAPSNIAIAVASDGTVAADAVRVLDFGLADAPGRPALAHDVLRSTLHAADPTHPEPALGVVGSINYLSPEHALGRPIDERGDLYQVAALLHFMVTGRPPFVRGTVGEVMAAHAGAPPPVPSVQVSGIPRAIDRIVVRGLLKQPDARFDSAADMRAAVVEAAAALRSARPAASATRVLAVAQPDAPTAVIVPARMRDVATTTIAASAPSPASASIGPASAATRTAPTPGPASAAPATAQGPRPRTVAAILALAAVALATIWLVAASAVPHVTPAASPAPPTPTATTTTPAPTTPPPRQAPAAATVPPLAGLSRAAAEQRARDAGLVIGTVTRKDGTQPEGVVLASAPAAGTQVARGASVTLVVASGANAVPAVAGLSEVAAGSAITAAGFIAAERPVIDTTVPDGTVLGTEPAAGVSARLGSAVVIVIARGPAATPTPDPSSGPDPAPTGTPPPTTGPTRP